MKFTKCFEKCLRVGIWLAVFAAGYLTVFPVTVYSADSEVSYTYIPDEKVSEIRVYLDDLRFLRGSWKGVNLFHKWGEMDVPRKSSSRFSASYKGRGKRYLPENGDRIYTNFAADIPVRVIREKGKVEYLWSQSYIQSDYRGFHYLPKKSDYLHLRSDFRQMNRLEIEKDRITLTTTMEFLKAPKKDLVFNPVLFPGRGKNRRYVKEFRILGTKCLVIDKDGKSESVDYPEEIKSQLWLDNEPRSLIFDLEEGRIRYNFSFSDPGISLRFYAHTGWSTLRFHAFEIPAIVAGIDVPAKKNFKDGVYKCSIKMEVVVGDAVTDEPGVEPPAELPVDRYLDVRVESGKPSHRFFVDDQLEFHILLDGFRNDTERALSVAARVLDYGNREVDKQELSLSLPDEADKPLELSIPSLGKGAFVLDVKLLENNEVVGFKAQRFCVIDHAVEYPPEKSFFGCSGGWLGFGASKKDKGGWSRATLSLLHDLGIKKLRWKDNWITGWPKVQPQPGKFIFPEKFYKLAMAKEVGMDCYLYGYGTFSHPTPEWARKKPEKRFENDFKDIRDYENYCYELVKRYKGLINTFSTDNELNIARYENDRERQDHIEMCAEKAAAAYRAIKRANPDALVIGGTICFSSFKGIKWLEDLLEYAKSRGWKLYDMIGPHGILKAHLGPPEDSLKFIKKLREVAGKYNLLLCNDESAYAKDPFHNIYPNFHFIKLEKDRVNHGMRDYLLEKSFGVEFIIICHACAWNRPGEIWGMEYESSQAAKFWGMGGFLKPWAVAHAALAQLLDGSDFRERVDLKYQDAWCMVYKRGRQTMAAVWMKEGEAKWNVSLPGGTEYRNIVGTSRNVRGKQRFTLTEEPFYLVAQGKAGAQLAKALSHGTLQPDRVIEIGKSRFTSGNKVLEVDVRNYWGIPLVIERARIKHEDGEVALEDVKIAGGEVTPIRFDLKKQLNPNGIWVDIEMDVEGKKFRREVFVAYRPATVEKAVADGYLVAVPAKGAVKVDGDLGEWKQAVPIELNSKSQVIYNELTAEDLGGWKGLDDLSGTGYVMWDEENFYFACKVTDDIYQNPYPDGASSTWNCDSIQISFDPLMTGKKDDRYYTDGHQEINLSLNAKGPAYYGRAFGTKYSDRIKRDANGQIPGARVAVKKWAKGLIYEFSMPLGELYPLKVKPGTITRFNFIINEDDGRGREMWIGITPGIGEKKQPALFRKLIFLE